MEEQAKDAIRPPLKKIKHHVMSMTSGRFDTSTKTKIKTPYGTVLKVTRYEEDSNPDIEYKVRPKCIHCKKADECYCFNEGDYENALESATELLQFGMVCDTPLCVIKQGLDNNPDKTNELILKYGDDVYAIADELWEFWGEWDEAPEECGV